MKGLGQRLTGDMSKSEKRKTINQYFRDCDGEKKYFAKLYPVFTKELEKTGNVTRAVHNLRGSEHTFVYQAHQFSKEFQIACVAAGKPLQTPTEYIEESGTKRKRKNNDEKGERTPAILDRYNSKPEGGYKSGKNIGSGHQH